MSFIRPQIFSEFLDSSWGRYEPPDDGTRSGIGFGRRFGVWENITKFFLFISFVHGHMPPLAWLDKEYRD
jgi:hypothetical protein